MAQDHTECDRAVSPVAAEWHCLARSFPRMRDWCGGASQGGVRDTKLLGAARQATPIEEAENGLP